MYPTTSIPITIEAFLVCLLIYTRASSPYSYERYATGATRISLPQNVAIKMIGIEIRNAPAKKENTLSGSGVRAAKNCAEKAFSAKSTLAFSANPSPFIKESILCPYDLYNVAPSKYIARAPTDEPNAEMSDNSFHEISFRYASTISKKASGKIGEMVASKNATTNVTDFMYFVLESLLMVASTCVKIFMNIVT